jgi:hypothetical protein
MSAIEGLLSQQQMTGFKRAGRSPMPGKSPAACQHDKDSTILDIDMDCGQSNSNSPLEQKCRQNNGRLMVNLDPCQPSTSTFYPNNLTPNSNLDCNSNSVQSTMPRCSICKAESTGIHFGVSIVL